MSELSGVLQSLPGFLQIVNVVALLSALYFFTSTISSHLIEVFVGFINSRGRQLRSRLELALGPEAARAFYDDPIIRSLSSGSGDGLRPPSYIEPKLFASVMAGLSAVADGPVGRSAVVRDIKDKLVKAPGELEPKLIEWFTAVTDRQVGVYTRWTFLRLLVAGLLMAAVLDIDTVHIAATLWNNPAQAEQAARALDDARRVSDGGGSMTEADRQQLQASVAAAITQLRAIAPPEYAWQARPVGMRQWVAKLLGWLLTALATSLGANFWFNLMSEALKLRSAGRKPEEPRKPAA